MSKSTNTNMSAIEVEICRILLDKHEMYAWKLVDESKKLKKHSIYNQLSRLERKGFVRVSRTEENKASEKHFRKYYQLTGLGQRVLDLKTMSNDALAGGLA